MISPAVTGLLCAAEISPAKTSQIAVTREEGDDAQTQVYKIEGTTRKEYIERLNNELTGFLEKEDIAQLGIQTVVQGEASVFTYNGKPIDTLDEQTLEDLESRASTLEEKRRAQQALEQEENRKDINNLLAERRYSRDRSK